MATRGAFRLRPLKLTSKQAGKKKQVEYIYRGISKSHEESIKSSSKSAALADLYTSSTQDFCGPSETATSVPTCYELESKASVAGWEAIRHKLLNVVTESAAMPIGQSCLTCKEFAVLKCTQCGPFGFYCMPCFEELHRQANFMHTSEMWEVGFSAIKYSSVMGVSCLVVP